jgi:hypothetical protein
MIDVSDSKVATRSPTIKDGIFIMFAMLLLFLVSCGPQGDEMKAVTISSDGKMVAVLDFDENQERRLRTKWLDKDGPWKNYPIPVNTTSIHFAYEGYDLLLAHWPEANYKLHMDNRHKINRAKGSNFREIIRVNALDPNQKPKLIHSGPYYTAPLEIKPGTYMFRSCDDTTLSREDVTNNNCVTQTFWIMLEHNKEPVRLTPDTLAPTYAQPNITDKGFFWISNYIVGYVNGSIARRNIKDPPKTHPTLISFPFPGGEAPYIEVKHLSPESDLICDKKIERCLRRYLHGNDKYGNFEFNIEINYRGELCSVGGLKGYLDLPVITQDGRAAAIPVAPAGTKTRHIVALHFKDGQCKPISNQAIKLKE